MGAEGERLWRGRGAVPKDWPDFPHHAQLFQYFKDYVDHFGLRESITFNTRVSSARRTDEGLWSVTLSTGETRLYDVLFVCNGHHWDPRTPEYPGEFDGPAFHAHAYSDPFDPVDMRGKNVVVVGMGNSAMDIAASSPSGRSPRTSGSRPGAGSGCFPNI